MDYDSILDLASKLTHSGGVPSEWGEWDDLQSCRTTLRRLQGRCVPYDAQLFAALPAVALVGCIAAFGSNESVDVPLLPGVELPDGMSMAELRQAMREYESRAETAEWQDDPNYVPDLPAPPPADPPATEASPPAAPAVSSPAAAAVQRAELDDTEERRLRDWLAALKRREKREIEDTVDEVNEDLRRLFGFDLVSGEMRACKPGDAPPRRREEEEEGEKEGEGPKQGEGQPQKVGNFFVTAGEEEEEDGEEEKGSEWGSETDSEVEAQLAAIHRSDRSTSPPRSGYCGSPISVVSTSSRPSAQFQSKKPTMSSARLRPKVGALAGIPPNQPHSVQKHASSFPTGEGATPPRNTPAPPGQQRRRRDSAAGVASADLSTAAPAAVAAASRRPLRSTRKASR